MDTFIVDVATRQTKVYQVYLMRIFMANDDVIQLQIIVNVAEVVQDSDTFDL